LKIEEEATEIHKCFKSSIANGGKREFFTFQNLIHRFLCENDEQQQQRQQHHKANKISASLNCVKKGKLFLSGSEKSDSLQ